MKKKIIILGSTGSIGKSTIEIISKNKNKFQILLLSTNTNVKTLIKQAKKFDVRNLVINNFEDYTKAKAKYKNTKLRIYNDFQCLDVILKKQKIFYAMISLVGIDGLKPTLNIIKYCKYIAIANKESLICGWNLIKKKLDKYKTKFIPVDSEHFSIFSLINNRKNEDFEKIYITASGGPFLKTDRIKFNKITLEQSLNHPNWKMGKKITVDSSTMMNKVFEVIEAKNIFDTTYKKISILIHPKSYVHAIVKFYDGTFKILAHEPDMKIPILNSLFQKNLTYKKFNSKPLNFEIINNLNLTKVDYAKFPLVKLLKNLKNNVSQYETVLISINDFFVSKFLKRKISYLELIKLIKFYANSKNFLNFRKLPVKNVTDIEKTRNYVYSKLETLGI
jgi:1-deoxy-D-xylulose-5-phosphate reductoisomerase